MFSTFRTWRAFAAMSLLAVAPLVACDNATGVEDPREQVVGTYTATTLVAIEDGDRFDALAEGFRIELKLHSDGTTSGSFHFPYGEKPGEPAEDVSLEGTWNIEWKNNAYIVTFDQPKADTLLRDVEFMVEGNRLVVADDEVNLVLTRK